MCYIDCFAGDSPLSLLLSFFSNLAVITGIFLILFVLFNGLLAMDNVPVEKKKLDLSDPDNDEPLMLKHLFNKNK